MDSPVLRLVRDEPRWIPAAEVARHVRGALKAAFPGVRFYVRSETYSMGSSVSVSWVKGPRARAVEGVVAPFGGISFDGMTDSTSYRPVTLATGEVVRASSYVMCQRGNEAAYPELVAAAEAMIRARCVVEGEGHAARFGSDWVDSLASRVVRDLDYREPAPMESAFRRVVLHEGG